MAESFIAIDRLRWEGGWIEPGQPVPTGDGRNYREMLQLGQIARVGDVPTRPAREHAQQLKDSKGSKKH
jgi:hypothetical protein